MSVHSSNQQAYNTGHCYYYAESLQRKRFLAVAVHFSVAWSVCLFVVCRLSHFSCVNRSTNLDANWHIHSGGNLVQSLGGANFFVVLPNENFFWEGVRRGSHCILELNVC